jgi:phospholipid/cholesterol/gamma-HCH transport system permease protein
MSLTATVKGERLGLAATGAWTAERATELEKIVDDMAARYGAARSIDIDLSGLERLDTFGAWLIERLSRTFVARGSTARIVNLSDKDRGLIEEVRRVNRASDQSKADFQPNAIVSGLDQIGRGMAEIGRSLVLLAHLLGALTVVVLRTIAHPSRLRLTSTVHHLEKVGLNAVPIIVLSTLLIGAILAQQGIFRFREFGADAYVVDMVTVLVLREIGVLIVCVMVAGRSGSAYTAELGSMKMREETDALRTMGLDPVEVLVLPRIIAIVIAVPLLTFHRCDRGALRRRSGLLALRGNVADSLPGEAAGSDLAAKFRRRHDQGAVHGAGDRACRLCRRLRGRWQRRFARDEDDGVGRQIDLPGHRARRLLRHVFRNHRDVRHGRQSAHHQRARCGRRF